MKASGRTPVCCAALILLLTSASAVQRLNSIDDLKRVDFGGSVPAHILVLLHWFANAVTIDGYNVINLDFNPDNGDNGDYGSHHYGNYEQLLDPLPRGNTRYRYYSVGNIYQDAARPLPPHVVDFQMGNERRNRDRIIVRVREQNAGRQSLQIIDQVYITQHYGDNQRADYDPDHTYLVTTNLLREIRQFPMNGDERLMMDLRNRFGSSADDRELNLIRNTWGHLACLGLLLQIVLQQRVYQRLQSGGTIRRHANDQWPRDNVLIILLLLFIAYFFLFGGSSKQQA